MNPANIASIEKKVKSCKKIMENQFRRKRLEEFRNGIEIISDREEMKHEERHRRKYWINKKRVNKKLNKNEQKVPYCNLSVLKITEYQDSLLRKGPKYIMNEKIDIKEGIHRIEVIIEKLPNHEGKIIRGEMQTEIEKKIKDKIRDCEDRKELESMRKNKEITFPHTDKIGKP